MHEAEQQFGRTEWSERPDVSIAVEQVRSEDLPMEVGPVSVVVALEGSLGIRTVEDGHLRLGPGEPLVVRSGPGVELVRAGAEDEIRVVTLASGAVRRMLEWLDVPAEVERDPVCAVAPRSREGRRLTRFLNEALDLERGGRPRAGAEVARLARSLELIAAILAAEGDPLAPRDRRHARSRQKIHEAVRELRLAEPEDWSLPRLAERLDLSTRQVSRLFQEELGSSFRDFVTELRLERTRSLLARTDRSVTDVALESGWRSLSHFTTVFRSRVGMTPRAYRRSLAGDDSCHQGSSRLE